MTDQPFTRFAGVWLLCGEASQAIYAVTRPFVNPIVDETGLTQPRVVHTLLVARAIEPDSISPERIWRRYPYATRLSWEQPITTLVERQLLEAQGDGSYRLTPGGRALVTRLLHDFYAGLAGIEKQIRSAYAPADVDRLTALLSKIVMACLTAPIHHAGLTDSHGLVPDDPATALAHVDQALDDLNAFRDDAHLAAWQPLGIAGEAWELFTYLWRGEVKNADEMTGKAAFRGHSPETYAAALEDLIGRGWVRAAGDAERRAFEVTAAGRRLREEVEATTDRYFYMPWQVLTDNETDDVHDLLTRLTPALQHVVEAVPA